MTAAQHGAGGPTVTRAPPDNSTTLAGSVSPDRDTTPAALPIYRRLEAHVLAAGLLPGGNMTVPVLAAGKAVVARKWTVACPWARPEGLRRPPVLWSVAAVKER